MPSELSWTRLPRNSSADRGIEKAAISGRRLRAVLIKKSAYYIKSGQCPQPRMALLCMHAGLIAREPRRRGMGSTIRVRRALSNLSSQSFRAALPLLDCFFAQFRHFIKHAFGCQHGQCHLQHFGIGQ